MVLVRIAHPLPRAKGDSQGKTFELNQFLPLQRILSSGYALDESVADTWRGPRQCLHRDRIHNHQATHEDFFAVSGVDYGILPRADSFRATNIIRRESLFARDTRFADENELSIFHGPGAAPLGSGNGSP